jgi:hypothetical protein
MKTIEILVAPNGQSTLETKGFSGAECRQASRFLEIALGNNSSDRVTDEHHQAVADQATRAEQQS